MGFSNTSVFRYLGMATRGGDTRLAQEMIEELSSLISYWDTDLRLVMCNRAYAEWFRTTPRDIQGIDMKDLLGEELVRANTARIRRAMESGREEFERDLLDHSGNPRHIHVTYVADIVDGEALGVFTIIDDLTRHHEVEDKIAEAEAIARLGSWSWNPATDELTWSAECYRIFGVDPAEFTPDSDAFIRLVHPDDRERAREVSRSAREQGLDYLQQYRIIRPDGQVRDLENHVKIHKRANGEVARLEGMYRDVTESQELIRELQRTNDELVQINQLNQDVIGMLGHDIRTPLTVVLGYLEELDEHWDALDESARQGMVARVRGSSMRACRLVNDILTMASAQSGNLRAHKKRVDVRNVLSEALADLPDAEGVALTLEVPGMEVEVDPFHLRQILVNLITNALRYGAAPIEVVATPQDTDAVISVIDHGPGVPAEEVGDLFHRFVTVRRDPEQHRGTGFGLYLVEQLARANGGTVAYLPATGDGPHRFEVRIPLL